MKKVSKLVLALLALPAISAAQVAVESGQSQGCTVKFGSPLIVFLDGDTPAVAQDVFELDLRNGWIGSYDAKMKLKECDRTQWHCLEIPGAPLYVPRARSAGQKEWVNGQLGYVVGESITVHQVHGMRVTPVFLVDSTDKKDNGLGQRAAVFLFDNALNLLAYGSYSSVRFAPGNYEEVHMNWIVDGVASIDCY